MSFLPCNSGVYQNYRQAKSLGQRARSSGTRKRKKKKAKGIINDKNKQNKETLSYCVVTSRAIALKLTNTERSERERGQSN
ncbi:MAG: hypothetical protein WBZ19_14610 [Chthoniobacterales bacterium]